MQTTDYEKQSQDFLDRFGIKFRATLSNSKPAPWSEQDGKFGHHYRITLSKGRQGQGVKFGQRITFDFWGSVHDMVQGRTELMPYDVLACISGDTHEYLNFKGWCSEFGYSEDSIQALQSYKRAERFSRRLRAFFTPEEIAALQEIQ